VRADRPSLTASLVAAIRALYTALPEPYNLAPDPYAAELLPAVLALPARVAALAPGSARAIHRVAGAAALGLTYHVALRTRAIDDALHEAVALGVRQVVVLGAGLDARAQRLDALAHGSARVFEVDHPSTHRYKAERLERAGARTRASVARVAIDFERDRLDEALLGAGLDPAARSFWIWEGVTVYLTPEAIAATLGAVGSLSPAGSRIAVTYTRPGRRRAPAWLDPIARALGRAVGEPIHGMLETAAMFDALGAVGFARVSDESAADWAARYWPGEKPVDEWERLAVAERTPG
jgi:methyltransferase (TIGR00027 family)